MRFKSILRKLFLCVALGGHSILGIGMSKEQIEELLYATNQARIEMTIDTDGQPNGLTNFLNGSEK